MINPVLNTPPAQGAKQSNAQTADGFGTVLARQMDAKTEKPHPAGKEVKRTDETANEPANPDTAPQVTADTQINPLAALLFSSQLPNTRSAPAADELAGKDKPATAADAVSASVLLPGNPEVKPAPGTGIGAETRADTNIVGNSGSGKQTPPDLTAPGITRDRTEAAAPAKTDPLVAVAPAISKETFKAAEAAASPTSAPPAQTIVQSQVASSLIPVALPPHQATITAPLSSRAWPDEFSQKISWVSTQQNQIAELHLNPPDLGPMSVVLSISDNQATALFTSPHSAVRDAIENAMPKLRESLAENGIMLGNATVSDQPSRDSGASGFMNQQPRRQTPGMNESASTPTPAIPVRRQLGVVDTFA